MSGGGIAVGIGVGSNLGDRAGHLRRAVMCLRDLLADLRVSRAYWTAPLHARDQPDFLNACCVGRTCLTPRQLLSALQVLERRLGRDPGGRRFGPRVIDLDLLLYGEHTIEEPDLVVPHPRLRERGFVLVPLREIAADWRVPGSHGLLERSVAELAEDVGSKGVVRTDFRLEDD